MTVTRSEIIDAMLIETQGMGDDTSEARMSAALDAALPLLEQAIVDDAGNWDESYCPGNATFALEILRAPKVRP